MLEMLFGDAETLWAVGPLALFTLTLLSLFGVYLLWGRRHEGKLMGGRRAESRVVSSYSVAYWYWLIGPVERLFVRYELSPNWITLAATAMSAVAGYMLYIGQFGLGGWLIIFSGTLDILDGKVARARGLSSKAGAFFDSAMDRYADIFVLVGLAGYYRQTGLFIIPLLALMGALATSYVRARGHSLGVDCKAGLMQRAERILLVGLGSALSPLLAVTTEAGQGFKYQYLSLGCVCLLALLSNYTAIVRIISIYRALDAQTDATVVQHDVSAISQITDEAKRAS